MKIQKNDVLLFEIKDTSMETTYLECIHYNFNVINGYMSLKIINFTIFFYNKIKMKKIQIYILIY